MSAGEDAPVLECGYCGGPFEFDRYRTTKRYCNVRYQIADVGARQRARRAKGRKPRQHRIAPVGSWLQLEQGECIRCSDHRWLYAPINEPERKLCGTCAVNREARSLLSEAVQDTEAA